MRVRIPQGQTLNRHSVKKMREIKQSTALRLAMEQAMNDITHERFDQELRSLGFTMRKSEPGTRVYRHETTGALVILPDKNNGDLIPQRHIIGTRMILDAYGILPPTEFATRFQHAS